MERQDERLMTLGRAIRDVQDQLPLVESGGATQRLMHVVPVPRRGRIRRWRWMAPALALAGAAVMVLVLSRPVPLTFRIAGSEGAVGAWIAAEKTSVGLDFSDGSSIVLDRAAQARVDGLDAAGAQIALERGRADARIVHRSSSRWRMVAGPFVVAVIGTRFSLDWEPIEQRLQVALHEGAVALSGPVVGELRRVRQGETLVVFAREGRLEVQHAGGGQVPQLQLPQGGPPATSLAAPATSLGGPAAAAPAELAEEPPAAAPPVRAPSHAQERGGNRAQQAPAWRTLAQANRYGDAVAAAEEAGFERICGTSSAPELRMLGDAARLAGRPELARRALASVRARFAGSNEAAVAAFLLGKLSFDNLRSFREASDWFSTYLAERPGGALAREAAGRLIEARRKSGDDAGARAAARAYLERHPDGPQVELARSVAGP